MVLTSDLSLDFSKFDPASVTPDQNDFNSEIGKMTSAGPRWYKVGAPEYRRLRETGQTPLPSRVVLEQGVNFNLPSRDTGRDIPCRYLLPSDGKPPVGIFMHIHGGGWVLQSEQDFDPFLQLLANGSGSGIPMAVVTVGYRLAPENPFPAAQIDCYDAADVLAEKRTSDPKLNDLPLLYIGGESAGGHLTVLTTLHLLSKPDPYRSLRGIVPHFGVFSLPPLPAHKNFDQELVLTPDIMEHYVKAVIPRDKTEDTTYLIDPEVSPLYAKLDKFRGHLPPALFTCGTADPLLDDTLFMGTKWMAAGQNHTFIKIYPGQPHGFVFFPADKNPAAGEAMADVGEFFKTTYAS